MPVAGSISFAVDGTVMTVQPSGIEEVFPEPVIHFTLGGGRIVCEPSQPANVIVTFGVEAAKKGAVTQLRTLRGAAAIHTITYTDIGGNTQERTVYIPQVPYSQFLLAEAVEQISITMVNLET